MSSPEVSDDEYLVDSLTQVGQLRLIEAHLQRSLSQVEILNVGNLHLVEEQLQKTGVCLVSVSGDLKHLIRSKCLQNLHRTFPRAPHESVRDFVRFWQQHKVSESGIQGKMNGMPNRFPLNKTAYPAMTDKDTRTVWIDNRLNALNNVEIWQILCQADAKFNPQHWWGREDYVTLCPDDGMKLAVERTYKPTGLHFDGQFGSADEYDGERLQVVYVADSGPVRLCVVPGSSAQLMQKVLHNTGHVMGKGFQPGVNLDKRLAELLWEHAVTVPGDGLLLFKADTWHMEAKCSGVKNGLMMADLQQPATSAAWDVACKNTSVMRVYMGLLRVQFEERLIRLMYYRLHGYAMDPFCPANKKFPFFVNHKTTQSWLNTSNAVPFDGNKSTEEMIQEIRAKRPSPLLMSLFGVSPFRLQ